MSPDDERAELRPGESQDRTEVMVAYALRRGEKGRVWASKINRTESGGIQLDEMTVREEDILFFIRYSKSGIAGRNSSPVNRPLIDHLRFVITCRPHLSVRLARALTSP